MKRKKLTKFQVRKLNNAYNALVVVSDSLENADIDLHYGNGSVGDQVLCAIAALECIYQEHEF